MAAAAQADSTRPCAGGCCRVRWTARCACGTCRQGACTTPCTATRVPCWPALSPHLVSKTPPPHTCIAARNLCWLRFCPLQHRWTPCVYTSAPEDLLARILHYALYGHKALLLVCLLPPPGAQSGHKLCMAQHPRRAPAAAGARVPLRPAGMPRLLPHTQGFCSKSTTSGPAQSTADVHAQHDGPAAPQARALPRAAQTDGSCSGRPTSAHLHPQHPRLALPTASRLRRTPRQAASCG